MLIISHLLHVFYKFCRYGIRYGEYRAICGFARRVESVLEGFGAVAFGEKTSGMVVYYITCNQYCRYSRNNIPLRCLETEIIRAIAEGASVETKY